MSLGRLLGEYELRIAELEEELARREAPKIGVKLGMMKAIRALLANGPMTIDEVAANLPQWTRPKIAQSMATAKCQVYLVRIGTGRDALYRLP